MVTYCEGVNIALFFFAYGTHWYMKALLTTFKEVTNMMQGKTFEELFLEELDKYVENLRKIIPNMDKVYSGFNENAEMMNVFDENIYKQFSMFREFNLMCTMLGVDKF